VILLNFIPAQCPITDNWVKSRSRTIPQASPSLVFQALPLEFLLDPAKSKDFPARVLARLIQSEAHEANPHFKDDYRQSFIALSLTLNREYTHFWDAFVAASYRMYGLHPETLYAAIEARRRAQLGSLYEELTTLAHRPSPLGPAGEALSVSKPLPGNSLPSPRKKVA
jgi:hypothetical protein